MMIKKAPQVVLKKSITLKPIVKPAKLPTKKVARSIATQDINAVASEVKKLKKTKLIRDSFTIPKDEFIALQKLKERAVLLAKPAKKGELLRAGLLALSSMPDTVFLSSLSAVTTLKTGRPKGAKSDKK
jgi:hypothetical protein